MEESDAFEFQLRALKAEVDNITRRLAGTEAGTNNGPGQVEPQQSSRRRTGGGTQGVDGDEEAEQARGASLPPISMFVPTVSPSALSSTLQPGVVMAPRSPPKIVRRHLAPRSSHHMQPAAVPPASATGRLRPSSAPPLMGFQADVAGPDGENEEEKEEEGALMVWVSGAKTPVAQLRRARQALRELLRERDAALQGLHQAQGESAGWRARVRELEGLEQDLATLKIALESSERIRLQQKGLLDMYKAQQQQQLQQQRHRPAEKGIHPPSSAPHLTHHDVHIPAAPSTPPAPAVADAAWVNQFFLDYSLRHPDPPPPPPPPPAHSDALLLTPAVVSSPGSGNARSSASSSRQKKLEAARLARRLRGDGDGTGAGTTHHHQASSGAASSATAASLRRASAAGLVLGAGARRPELSEESLRWRRYPDGEEDEREGGNWSRPSGAGSSSGGGGRGAGQANQTRAASSTPSKSGGTAPMATAASRVRAGAVRSGASPASSSANTSASSLASAAGGLHLHLHAPGHAHINGPRRKALAAPAPPATAGASPFDSPATTTSGTRLSSASSLATKGPSPGGGPVSAEGKGKGKARRAGGGETRVGEGRSKGDAARLWS